MEPTLRQLYRPFITSASEVTTLWHYTNLFVIIIIKHNSCRRRTRGTCCFARIVL